MLCVKRYVGSQLNTLTTIYTLSVVFVLLGFDNLGIQNYNYCENIPTPRPQVSDTVNVLCSIKFTMCVSVNLRIFLHCSFYGVYDFAVLLLLKNELHKQCWGVCTSVASMFTDLLFCQ